MYKQHTTASHDLSQGVLVKAAIFDIGPYKDDNDFVSDVVSVATDD